MRILGMILICLSGIGTAFCLVERERVCLDRSRALLELLTVTRELIDGYALPVSEILCRCDRELLLRCGYPEDAEIPADFSRVSELCDIPDAQSLEALRRFALEFGRSSRREQLERCTVAIDTVRARCGAIEERLPVRRRLAVGLCLSLAAVLIILLL